MLELKKKLYIVAGPTGVGKSLYAIELAKKINGEIISLDSVQIYKYLDIGSGKVSFDEMGGIKHYMISEIEPSVNFNVKEFVELAKKYIKKVYEEHKIPILVGGSGFYIHALLYDNDFLFEDDDLKKQIRDEIYEKINHNGINGVYEELKSIDLKSYEKIPMNNVKKIVRALEFYRIHKVKISDYNLLQKEKESKFKFDFYVLIKEREELYDIINRRVDTMIKKGLLTEVKFLIDKGLDLSYNSMKSIGYKELYNFCKNRTYEQLKDYTNLTNKDQVLLTDCIDLIKKNTRHYAKRQILWFKNEKEIQWIKV